MIYINIEITFKLNLRYILYNIENKFYKSRTSENRKYLTLRIIRSRFLF